MAETLHNAAALAGDLPGLLLQAEKVAHSFMKGVHGRRRVGMGEAFWQFRHYAPGDSARDIDWRQTAKRDDAYVRELEWEAAQTVWMYRDGTDSMNFRSSKNLPTKKDYAEVLLLALSMLALNGGEQVGLLGTDLAPQSHYNSIQRLFEYLPHQTHLSETGRSVAAKSHVALFSDFYYPVENLTPFCEKLALRHVQGVLVQIFDPAEQTLPYKGRVKFIDAEDANGAIIMPQVEAVRVDYERKFEEHQKKLGTAARAWGWRFLALSTATPPEQALGKLYDMMTGE